MEGLEGFESDEWIFHMNDNQYIYCPVSHMVLQIQ